jgi:peptidoglycan/xylan/chitin deacetylase (PgdA/CDA1 family)
MLKKSFFIFARYSGLNALYEKLSIRRLRIIGYHSVLSEKSPVAISPELFESQIKYLTEHGHTFIHFSDISDIENLKSKKSIYKPTIIYFDDGFTDNLTIALPILQKYNVTATVFVVPAYADASNRAYMMWDEIRTLDRAGIEIGSHTYHHAVLTKLSPTEVKVELETSKTRIEKEIGHSISTFSYPKGRYSKDIARMVREAGYTSAISTEYGTNSIEDIKNRRYTLKKVAPRVYENMSDFIVRLNLFNFLYDIRN